MVWKQFPLMSNFAIAIAFNAGDMITFIILSYTKNECLKF